MVLCSAVFLVFFLSLRGFLSVLSKWFLTFPFQCFFFIIIRNKLVLQGPN